MVGSIPTVFHSGRLSPRLACPLRFTFYITMAISIRATNLEKFLTCPYRYKYEPEPAPDKMAFIFGTALHKLVEMHVQWIENQDAVDIILNRFGVKERKMLKALTECFIKHLEERELEYVLSEYSYTHKFEDIKDENWDSPILEWTFDLLFKDKEWQYIFVDIKTASKHWDDEHINSVNQKRIYPALALLESWIKVSKFEYRVMNKTLSPKLQEVVFEVPDDNTETVTDYMRLLVNAEDNLDFPAAYTNYSCFFCAIRQQCRAMNNLYNNNDKND